MGKNTMINGRYAILKELGEGASARVYLVEDIETGTKAALKIIHDERYSENAGERELIQKLFHPGLPHIQQVWANEGGTYVIMDYVEGESPIKKLDLLDEEQRVDQVIDFGIQLCKILIYLHGQNPPLLYRDLKPDNILCDKEGKIRLVDFGAVMRKTGKNRNDCMGTRGYAAPEQYTRRGKIDIRTDVYCLGKTLQTLLTGQRPCDRKNSNCIFERKYHTKEPRREGLYRIIKRCTWEWRIARYSSCTEVLLDLERLKKQMTMHVSAMKIK